MRSTRRALARGKRHPTGRAERARAERARDRQRRPSRADLEAELADARATGDKQRLSELYAKMMLTPRERDDAE